MTVQYLGPFYRNQFRSMTITRKAIRLISESVPISGPIGDAQANEPVSDVNDQTIEQTEGAGEPSHSPGTVEADSQESIDQSRAPFDDADGAR